MMGMLLVMFPTVHAKVAGINTERDKADEFHFTGPITWEVHNPTNIRIQPSGIVTSQNLFDDSMGLSFSNHRGFLQFRASVSNSSAVELGVFSEYLHQEWVIEISPSLSIDSIGIGISDSYSYKRMSPNPYKTFKP